MKKEDAILEAKSLRQAFDAPLQSLKDFIKRLSEAVRGNPQLDKELENSGETIAQAKLSQRDLESAIMRLGMVLKNIGNPTPYGQSKLTAEQLAQNLYEAYAGSTGWKSAVTGADLPQWDAMLKDDSKREVVAGWVAAAKIHPALLYVAPTADNLKL